MSYTLIIQSYWYNIAPAINQRGGGNYKKKKRKEKKSHKRILFIHDCRLDWYHMEELHVKVIF